MYISLILSVFCGIIMTLIIGTTWHLLSKKYILRNVIAVLFLVLVNVLIIYFTKTINASVLNYYYLYSVFPFCISFLFTALIYGWFDVIREKKKDIRLILVTFFLFALILITFISYEKEWFSISQATNMYIIQALTVGTIINLIQSTYMKIKQ